MQEIRANRLGNIYGEDRGTGFAGNVWDKNSISPTLTTMSGGGREPHIIEVGYLEKGTGKHQSNVVFSEDGLSPTLCAGIGVKQQPTMHMEIVAMRGRDPENPSDRTTGNPNLEQRLEINSEGISNCLTTVQKDNMVLIKQATKEGYIPCELPGIADLSYPNSKTRRGRVIGGGKVSPTLTTDNIPSVLTEWLWEIDGIVYLIRIRKLTPKECWRLMDFLDEDYEKAAAVNSNTQLYKQAGNSIVVSVLENVFKQLL